jgi:hypothetical protein
MGLRVRLKPGSRIAIGGTSPFEVGRRSTQRITGEAPEPRDTGFTR